MSESVQSTLLSWFLKQRSGLNLPCINTVFQLMNERAIESRCPLHQLKPMARWATQHRGGAFGSHIKYGPCFRGWFRVSTQSEVIKNLHGQPTGAVAVSSWWNQTCKYIHLCTLTLAEIGTLKPGPPSRRVSCWLLLPCFNQRIG